MASGLSVPFQRWICPSTGSVHPIVICLDSERKGVFPAAVHGVLAEVVTDLVNKHNTGRRSPLQFEDRDFVDDNRGIIDECSPVG